MRRGRVRGLLGAVALLLVSPARAGEPADAVRNHLGAGECQQALMLAESILAQDRESAEGWRLTGDSHRCAGAYRDAVLAYRQVLERTPKDRTVQGLIGSLTGQLYTLDLEVQGADREAAPALTLADAAGAAVEPWAVEGTTRRFRDLDPAIPLQLAWSGPGYRGGELPVSGAEAGAALALAVELEFVGTGALSLLPWESAVVVTVVAAGVRHPVPEGGELTLTAGPATVEVASELGTVRQPVDVAPDGTTELDVQSLVPGRVTLLAVPEGSTITRLADDGTDASRRVPPGTGELNETLGLRLSAVPFDGLLTGPSTFRLDHPLLGTAEMEVFAVGGEISAQPVDWASMDGTAALQDRWLTWQRESRGGKRKAAGDWAPFAQEQAEATDTGSEASAATPPAPATAGAGPPRGLLAAIGGGTAAAGAAVFGISTGRGLALQDELATPAGYAAHRDAYEAARGGQIAGGVVMAAGTAALVGGIVQLALQKAHDKRRAARTARSEEP